VAGIIAAVVLGGLGLDAAIAAPSAGRLNVGGGPVYLTAAPGWVLVVESEDGSGAVTLQKGDAVLLAGAFQPFRGTPQSLLAMAKASWLDDPSAQIDFGPDHDQNFGPNPAAVVGFVAIVPSSELGSVTVEGELVCMVLDGNAVLVTVDAPQGDLDPVMDDIEAMLASLEVAQ
jgi:hypothetical protein